LTKLQKPFSEVPVSPRWLHGWAVFTACATVALLTLGAVVTTFRVGMADPVWPTYPWHMLLISYDEPRPGYLIEHTHRLAGYIVGCCVIVLAIGLWRYHGRRWLGWLGLAALGGVIIQGLLGGFRVLLNALVGTDLALIHGLFAQLVFALLVSLAVFTSRRWATTPVTTPAEANRVWRWSVLTVVLVYLQLIFGAILRHTYATFAQHSHILVAVLVVAAVAWLLKSVVDQKHGEKHLTLLASVLATLVGVQVFLGIEALLPRLITPGLPEAQLVTIPQGIVRTAHFVLGSLIFATAVAVSLWARRGVTVAEPLPKETARCLEGVA
jgi:cytochrome c oxidase assembly protein subunit 15